jgi:serine/threonine-protein kinase
METEERLKSALADRYCIEREIGAGGMATVYLAEDLKHRRKVAVKVLSPDLAEALGAERFLREIETVANLTHPHILPLFDSGEAEGFLYYVMPFLEGESLRDRLTREKQLPVDDAVQITREVAGALAYAHERGVIHRDVKPANILIEAGHAVLADFGVAQAVAKVGEARITQTGVSLGTPSYMSPEQATVERELDGRTDQYALACVLYEMLAGQPPFTGPTGDSVIRQHLTTEPTPVTVIRPAISASVAAALRKALAKTPADRFGTIAELSLALSESTPEAPRAEVGRRIRSPSVLLAMVAFVILAFVVARSQFTSAGGLEVDAVAVLPPGTTGDPEQDAFLSDVHKRLIREISRATDLASRPWASTQIFRLGQMTLSEFAQEVDADAGLELNGTQSADSCWIEASLWGVVPEEHLVWDSTFSGHRQDQLRIIRRIALSLGEATGKSLSAGDRASLPEARRVNSEALKAYQSGAANLDQANAAAFNRAIEFFSRAIELDSSFARPYAGLSMAYCMQGLATYRPTREVADSARLRADQALALDSRLAEGHLALGCAKLRFSWDMEDAETAFRRALELDDQLVLAHQWYVHLLLFTGREREALERAREAVEVAPLALLPKANLPWALAGVGEEAEALRTSEEVRELWPDWPQATMNLVNAYSILGNFEAAAQLVYDSLYAKGEALPRELRGPAVAGWWGLLLGLAGYREEASTLLAELFERQAAGEFVNSDAIAWVYVGLGQHDEAMVWLQRAYDEREQGLVLLKLRPFDALRGNPRFEMLLQDVFGEYAGV